MSRSSYDTSSAPSSVSVSFLRSCFLPPRMTDRDAVLLTPFNQWRKYRNFPLKIVLHFAIVFLITLEAVLLSVEFIPYNRANEQTFQRMFHLEEYEDGIYTIDDFLYVLDATVNNYYLFPNISVERYDYLKDENFEPLPVKLTLTRYEDLTGLFWNPLRPHAHKLDDDDIEAEWDTNEEVYHLTTNDTLGPFRLDQHNYELQIFFYSLEYAQIDFSFRSVNVGPLAVLPVIWDISLYFDFHSGQCDFDILISMRVVRTQGLSGIDTFTAILTVLLVLSFLSAALSLMHVLTNIRVYQRTKRRYKALSKYAQPEDPLGRWSKLDFSTKAAFFSYWSIFNLAGCCCVLVACILGLAEEAGYNTSAWFMILLGLGCMMACFNMLRYLEYYKEFYLHIQTLRNASSHIFRFCVSITPVYWGYAIFGVLNFGPYSEKFQDIDDAIVTLFALLTGDDIHDTFSDIIDNAYPVPVVSRIYLFSFCTIFITSVLNVCIFIIEDAFQMAKISTGQLVVSAPVDQKSKKIYYSSDEILHDIFVNLEVWERRMNEGMEPLDTEDGVPLSVLKEMPSGEIAAASHLTSNPDQDRLMTELMTRMDAMQENLLRQIREELRQQQREPAL